MYYNKLRKIKNKKGAIELSIGTVVIIVLAMSMLILGIILIKNIFGTATGAIKEIDQGVKNELNKLFSENQDKVLVLYPDSGIIKLEQGSQDEGFVVAIRNTDNLLTKTFSYRVEKDGIGSCGTQHPLDSGKASIIVGSIGSGITLNAGNIMENPSHVRLGISDTAPTCTFRLKITANDGSTDLPPAYMDIEILPK
ncbi:MAG: hypothetical protein KJ718_03825 [Nanoarchaeota archaeon]|nr:hypothetical protein [Nanoarchaeota archaeon]MBU1051657.1 hypothetical protein [Nanoarchaeota archaeon]MBU1988792.1 hypothetical protein [Nanoarchaeota archaeon]